MKILTPVLLSAMRTCFMSDLLVLVFVLVSVLVLALLVLVLAWVLKELVLVLIFVLLQLVLSTTLLKYEMLIYCSARIFLKTHYCHSVPTQLTTN